MACSNSCLRTNLVVYNFIILISIASVLRTAYASCERFTSIISFGDSYADTGNLLYLSNSGDPLPCALPPYGQTYFHASTGRWSDGRLIIDFLAQYLGLPLVPPYIGGKNGSDITNINEGVNFAVAGVTAMYKTFFDERGVSIALANGTLGTQLGWFKNLFSSLCRTSSGCDELLESALILVGEIGCNDYSFAFLSGMSIEVVETLVAPVVNTIISTVNELLDMGAMTLVVPGSLPIGCSTASLTYFMTTSSVEDYDPRTGCLIWLNNFAMRHNTLLQIELSRIQELHPRANIIYADYFNTAMQLFLHPKKFGFSKENILKACCGGNGPYDYNSSVMCGQPSTNVCEDPSLYVNWDGSHLTEAAYSFIFQGLFQGPFTVPPFKSLCTGRLSQ